MRKGKALRALLPVVMAVSVFAGCGESQETMGSAAGTVKEEIAGTGDTAQQEEESMETEQSMHAGESLEIEGITQEDVQEEPKEPKPLVLAMTEIEDGHVERREEYEYE